MTPEPSKLGVARRRWLTAAVGGLALAGGGGLAWWQSRENAADTLPAGFWDQRFDGPSGETLAMAQFRGAPLLLNFWATWCPPCVEEMPLLDAFAERHGAAFRVVGLAIDQPSAVRQFLRRTPVRYPIGMAGLGGTELARALGNITGGLPFTVVFGADGRPRQRRMGRLSAQDLANWAGA